MACLTLAEIRLISGEKRQRFFHHIRTTYVLPPHHLQRVARDSASYSPLMRAAALRNLVAAAPVHVTQGLPFARRRKLVREHYKV